MAPGLRNWLNDTIEEDDTVCPSQDAKEQQMAAEIASKITQIVEGIALRKVSPDEPLLTSGLVDSISAVDLALQMEAEFGIQMPAEKIHEHMETTNTLIGYVLASRY